MASGDGIDAIELADISININDTSNNNSNINNNDNDNNDTQTATLNGTTNSNSSSNNTVVAQHNNVNNNILTLSLKPDSSVNTIVAATTSQEDVTHLHSPNEMVPALPVSAVVSSSRQLFHAAAAAHGGDDSNAFMQQEQQLQQQQHQQQQQQLLAQQRLRSASSTLDASISRNPSSAARHEKKIGHRRVDEGGEVTYKKIQSKQIMGSIQLGIQHTVGSLASKPKRDLLMNDFWEMETIAFPPEGSSITPAHHFSDFRFKVYAPIAFRYFRDLFGIAPDDFLISMVASPLLQLSNPGASGSIFYLTDDDEFIIKTVQKKECEFLQKLLPGYYMNLSQNPRTLLPKFFGLYCFHYNSKNVRLVAMNNLLPSDIKMHEKYDLKGSTFRRKASKAERQKPSPTFKDLDFMDRHPNGIFLETDKYNALMKTIQRDCTVLESFQIMDYSLLVGIHNLDQAAKERRNERIMNARAKLERNEQTGQNDENAVQSSDAPISGFYNNASSSAAASVASNLALAAGATAAASTAAAAATALNRSRSMNRPRLVAHSTAIESITADMGALLEEDEDMPAGGIPARSENDERLILYIGIIDILQSYRLEKKLEHTFKSIIYNGDTVSVCRPSFYAQRFLSFMGKTVFKKTPTFPLKHSPSKRKTSAVTMQSRTPQSRTPHQQLQPSLSAAALRPTLMSGSSTPPPAFDDISEEDITSNSATATMSRYGVRGGAHSPRHLLPQRSYMSSQRSSGDDDYSDNDYDNLSMLSGGGMRSPQRLSKTNVQQQQATHGTVVLESNGQPLLATATTTTTTTIKAQTYTSTLVLDGVSR